MTAQSTTSSGAELRPFTVFCLLKAETGGENDPWVVSGPLASEDVDLDGDIMERSGIIKGLERFMRLGGHVDFNHLYAKTGNLNDIVGRGEVLYVDGRPWLKTTLDKANSKAREIWDFVKSKRHIGYSIQGSGMRHPHEKQRIVSTNIDMVTIAPQPKGFDQFLQIGVPENARHALQKAVSDAAYALGASCDVPASCLITVAKALVADTPCEGVLPAWIPLAGISKALEVGTGVVQPGTTGGAALRGQYMEGSDENDSSESKRKKRKDGDDCECEPVGKAHSLLSKAFAQKGVPNPDGAANVVLAHLRTQSRREKN